MLRQVIVTIMGNVDSGKSHTIDIIKKTSIVKSEPGKITQTIKAYSIDLDTIKKMCVTLSNLANIKIPGLLLIDTPGHAAFTNLRKRGGSLADIAILVIDINEGIKPQTVESIEILKENKTPFIISLNKIDLIPGWRDNNKKTLIDNLNSQSDQTKKIIESKLYGIVAKIYEFGLNTERFDRVEDFTKTVAIVPTSAKTSEGIPELLMVITGLAQKFLETKLKYNSNKGGEGTVLEIKEEKGLGTTLDIILYDGKIKQGDTIVIGTLQNPLVTKAKAIFLTEKKTPVNEVEAASGLRLICPETKDVIPGMPIKVVNNNLEEIKQKVLNEVKKLTLEIDNEGIIIKADSLGSLEALIQILKEKKVKIKRASISNITKKDIAEALASNSLDKVILGFRVKSIQTNEVKIITSDVIYTLLEDYEKWYKKEKENSEKNRFSKLVNLTKIQILAGYVFRKSGPAIVGCDVLEGTLKTNTPLFKDDKKITEVKGMQKDGKAIQEGNKGDSLAVSLTDITIGKQVNEGDILYSHPTESQFKEFKELKEALTPGEKQILKEIAELKRKNQPSWGL